MAAKIMSKEQFSLKVQALIKKMADAVIVRGEAQTELGRLLGNAWVQNLEHALEDEWAVCKRCEKEWSDCDMADSEHCFGCEEEITSEKLRKELGIF